MCQSIAPTAGHPWSMDPGHQDVADRNLLNRHVRYYGDDVAAVIAEDEVSAMQACARSRSNMRNSLRARRAEGDGRGRAPHSREFPGNILKHTDIRKGNYQEAIQRSPDSSRSRAGTIPPTVQHSHIENHGAMPTRKTGASSSFPPRKFRTSSAASSVRRWASVGRHSDHQAYIGGGFGNKQDALYEPLCAWCSTQVNGRRVRIDCSREETFVSNRVRHAIRFHIITWLSKDGSIAARKIECFSNQGAYASHGHSIVAKAMGSFPQIYPCEKF